MLTITSEQRALLDEHARRGFINRACVFLRQQASSDTSALTESQLQVFVKQAMQEAASFGIHGERSVMRWLLLQIVAGPLFDRDPEVEAALRRSAKPEHTLKAMVAHICLLEARHRP